MIGGGSRGEVSLARPASISRIVFIAGSSYPPPTVPHGSSLPSSWYPTSSASNGFSPVHPMTTKSSDFTAFTFSQKGLRCPGTYGLCVRLATTPSRPRSRHASNSSTPSSSLWSGANIPLDTEQVLGGREGSRGRSRLHRAQLGWEALELDLELVRIQPVQTSLTPAPLQRRGLAEGCAGSWLRQAGRLKGGVPPFSRRGA